MKKNVLFLSLLFSVLVFSQEKDLDFDGRKDFVYLDTVKSVIVCKLSTQNFKKIESKPIEIYGEFSRIELTKSGFELSVNWMRSGFSCQFRYDQKTKRMQLIGMSRYEFGPASNDGSGESSVNLLTGNYIGEWNYWDEWDKELKKIPTIRTKMNFGKIYLENFDDTISEQYQEQCYRLYEKHKAKEKNL